MTFVCLFVFKWLGHAVRTFVESLLSIQGYRQIKTMKSSIGDTLTTGYEEGTAQVRVKSGAVICRSRYQSTT